MLNNKPLKLILSLVAFISCDKEIKTNKITALSDTIVTKNGYTVVLKNGELDRIFSSSVFGSTVIDFYTNNTFNILTKNNTLNRKFSFHNNNLYKINYGFYIDGKFINNQIINIDTLSWNFIIKKNSVNLILEGLDDTILHNQQVDVRMKLSDSILNKFKLKIVDPDVELAYMYKNVIREMDFYNKNGVVDKFTLPEKKGWYIYQGVIENYFVREDGAMPMYVYFFKKRIYVK